MLNQQWCWPRESFHSERKANNPSASGTNPTNLHCRDRSVVRIRISIDEHGRQAVEDLDALGSPTCPQAALQQLAHLSLVRSESLGLSQRQ